MGQESPVRAGRTHLIGWVAGKVLLRYWTATPPSMPADVSIIAAQARDAGRENLASAKSWFARREGLPVVFLKGSPFEIGWAEGQLLPAAMHTLENDFMDMIHSYVPEDWKIDLLKSYVIYRNRHLTDFVPLNYRLEIYGTTLGCPDGHPELGPYYNRMLNYHAAHDISYMMIDNPLVSRAGCTAFGAWAERPDHAHLITGRNFDLEAAEVFSRDRVVLMCEPDGGIPLISLSWAGMGRRGFRDETGGRFRHNQRRAVGPAEGNRHTGGDPGARRSATGAQFERSARFTPQLRGFLSRRSGWSAAGPTADSWSWKRRRP